MANDVEHRLIFLLAICICWGGETFKQFVHFKLEFCLFIIELKDFFKCILDIVPIRYTIICKAFLLFVGHSVTFNGAL